MRSKPATQYIAWRNRMRTQHPNLWHPIRFAIMLIVLAWTIYGVCYEPPTDIFGVIWVAMLVTALVLSPLFLKSTSVAILVIASIGDLFTPYAHLGNSLPAQLYAYGMLAYSTNAIIVATLLIYYVVNILLIDPPDPNTNPVAMVSMYAMVLLLGRTLSWSEKTTQKSFEAAQNKNRLQELESRARIADAIHDAVTGDLSAASFVAQRHIGGNSSGPGVAADPCQRNHNYGNHNSRCRRLASNQRIYSFRIDERASRHRRIEYGRHHSPRRRRRRSVGQSAASNTG